MVRLFWHFFDLIFLREFIYLESFGKSYNTNGNTVFLFTPKGRKYHFLFYRPADLRVSCNQVNENNRARVFVLLHYPLLSQLFHYVFFSAHFNVSVAIFSGMSDPMWKVSQSDPNYREISDLLRASKTYSTDAMTPRLGYRGFIVQEGKEAQLVVGLETVILQHRLLQSMPPGLLSNEVIGLIQEEINSGAAEAKHVVSKRMAHPYNPGRWQGLNFRARICNNCYNYANIRQTNDFAQPGVGGRNPFGALTGPNVEAAAVTDGLALLAPQPPPGPVVVPPAGNSHMVALVVWPG